jgi:hypothetical protein
MSGVTNPCNTPPKPHETVATVLRPSGSGVRRAQQLMYEAQAQSGAVRVRW